MTILGLDTSGPVCSVALMDENGLCYESRAVNRLTHSKNLMPMVDQALHFGGKALKELSLIACVVGPGSFTGVRIGVAAAQGMARGLGIPCLAVNALEMMAGSLLIHQVVICPIRDARAGQVYGAAFQDGKRLMDDQALKLCDYLERIAHLGDSFVFLGDGVMPSRQKIEKTLGKQAGFAPSHLIQPGAAAACEIARLTPQSAVPPEQLMPIYLRKPQAERMLEKKHA